MNPSAKVITGPLHSENKTACDWGHQGFLAYGCHDYVVVIDPKSLQVIQTVGPHKACVTHVIWCRERYHHAFATGSTYNLFIACADLGGTVIIWDVVTGNIRTEFCDTQQPKPILCMEWYVGHDESHDLLMILRSPDTLEMWDAYAGVCLWKKQFTETLTSFVLDPFDIRRLAFQCESVHLLVLSDVTATTEPSAGRHIHFIDPCPVATASRSRRKSSSSDKSSIRTSSSWTKMAASMATTIISGPESLTRSQSQSEESMDMMTSCKQIVFNPAHRHIVLLVFPGEIQILDIDVDLVVGYIRLDRAAASFTKVYPCMNVDMLLCQHDNGSTSVRVRKSSPSQSQLTSPVYNEAPVTTPVVMGMTYDLRCQSDPIRLLRQCKVGSFVVQPITERQMALVLTDSRVIIIDVMATEFIKSVEIDPPKVTFSLSDEVNGKTVMPPHGQDKFIKGQVTLRLIMSGLVSGVISPVTVVAMVPAVMDRQEAGMLIAVGSSIGTIQLVNVYSGAVEHEFKLFMSPVRNVEWIDSCTILSYTYPDPPSYGSKTVKSEILILNIKSGAVFTVRESKDKDNPILKVKVSPSREFFVVAFKDKKTLEMWNIHSRQLVREINMYYTAGPYDVAWYPYVTRSMIQKVIETDEGGTSEVDKTVTAEQLFICAPHDNGILIRVNLLDGFVSKSHYLSIESLFNTQSSKAEIICIAWKLKFLVLADKGGQLYLSDARTSSPAKKVHDKYACRPRSIKFGPGASNLSFLVLYTEGIDVWNILNDNAEFVSSSPPLPSPVVDAEWVGPDSVVMVTENGCLHVLNITPRLPATPVHNVDDGFFHVSDQSMKIQKSPCTAWKISDVFSPALLEAKTSFLLKYSLQCGIEPFNPAILKYLKLIDRDMYRYIKESSSTSDRCYMVARLFGDEFDIAFWRLFKYTTNTGKLDQTRLTDINKPLEITEWLTQLTSSPSEVNNLVDLDLSTNDLEGQGDMDISWLRDMDDDTSLVSNLNVLMNGKDYKQYESGRLSLHNKKRCSYKLQQLCARRYIMMGHIDMAVQLLMETDTEKTDFKSDCFKACLCGCVQQSSSSLSTMKLVATHMIAAGNVHDGVDLLCLVNKRLDACKYLMSYGEWQDAVWMAKTSLDEGECLAVMCKWTEYLWNNNQRDAAVLIMLSLGQYTTVLRMLYDRKQYDTAALFLQTCCEKQLLHNTDQSDCVYVDFAKLLSVIDYQSAMEHYCHLAGTKGDNFLQ